MKMPGVARRAPLLTALVLAVLLASAARLHAASYPPWYHFQTVSTDHVSVHFPQGFEAMARQAATMATEILSWHEARYGQKVGRVQIVIADADDQSNGFASPLPFPLVTIRAVSPDGTDDFGNHEGWLRLVLTHELAHTVHLEESRGLWGFGRKLFGRAPFLFPNTLAMSWMIEGLATYEETELTAFGRGRNPDSRMVIRTAALEGRFPKEDQAIYALEAWPGGQVPYLFGEAFLRRLTEQSGEDTIPKLGRQHAGQFPPFLDGRTRGQGHRHRPPRPLDGVGHAGHRGGRAGRRRAKGAGPDAVPPRDRHAASARSRPASAPTARGWPTRASR